MRKDADRRAHVHEMVRQADQVERSRRQTFRNFSKIYTNSEQQWFEIFGSYHSNWPITMQVLVSICIFKYCDWLFQTKQINNVEPW